MITSLGRAEAELARRRVPDAKPRAEPALLATNIATGYNGWVKRILFTAAADRQRRKLAAAVDQRLRAKLDAYAATGARFTIEEESCYGAGEI